MTTNPMKPSAVCGIVVSYQPDDAFCARLPELATQLGHVVVVDNGSDDVTRHHIRRAIEAAGGTFIAHTANNLAAAQNLGISRARELGFGHVLLLDDDSTPAPDMVEKLLEALHAPSPLPLALAAAHMQDSASCRVIRYARPIARLGFRYARVNQDGYIDGAMHVIASGSLIPLTVLDAVGGMDEELVIDYVDKEWCLRAQKAGYSLRVCMAATLHHQIGHSRDHRLAGLRVTSTNHSPERRFTIYRNRLRCWWRYGRFMPAFVVYDALGIGYDVLRVIGFEDNKKAKLCAMWRGVVASLSRC